MSQKTITYIAFFIYFDPSAFSLFFCVSPLYKAMQCPYIAKKRIRLCLNDNNKINYTKNLVNG